MKDPYSILGTAILLFLVAVWCTTLTEVITISINPAHEIQD